MDTLLYNEYAGLRQEKEDLEKRKKEYEKLKSDLSISEQELAREEKRSVLAKVFHNMWFPFSADTIGTVFSTALTLLITIFAAGAVPFVLIGGVLCIVVNIVWAVLYVAVSPIIAIFIAIRKPIRIKKYKSYCDMYRYRIENFDIDGLKASIGKCARRIYTIERDNPDFSDKYEGKGNNHIIISDSVKETEFYKEAYDKYFRFYMGYPPKDENKTLPDYATDVTLDLHPGDY